jgi:hypothetical protein
LHIPWAYQSHYFFSIFCLTCEAIKLIVWNFAKIFLLFAHFLPYFLPFISLENLNNINGLMHSSLTNSIEIRWLMSVITHNNFYLYIKSIILLFSFHDYFSCYLSCECVYAVNDDDGDKVQPVLMCAQTYQFPMWIWNLK